jgi:hypothetical protein
MIAMLVGLGAAAILAAGCGGSVATPSAGSTSSRPASARPSASAPSSQSPSGSPGDSSSPSASPSPTEGLGLQHVDAKLEDKLPGMIGNVQLEKFSLPLSTYIRSSQGGDKVLYTPWLVPFGKSPDDVNIAIAADLTQTENFFVQAVEVPGQTSAALSTGFAAVARDKKWPVSIRSVADKTVLEITDPTVESAGGIATAYVWASGDILYVIVTDDPNLLVEALIKLQ